MSSLLTRRYSFFILLSFGVLTAIFLNKTKTGVHHSAAVVPPTAIEYIEAKILPVQARALGYGAVRPTILLKANAELAGKVVYLHPDLKKGASLLKDTVVIKLDRTSLALSLAQAQADLAVNQANRSELNVDAANTRASLDIANRTLALGEKELARKQQLAAQKTLAQSNVDLEAQNVLRLRQEVQTLRNQMASLPSRKAVNTAQIARAQAQVQEQAHNLAKTHIRLPFDARIGDVFIAQNEFVATGAQLFEASNVDQVEIDAQLSLIHARPLVLGLKQPQQAAPMSQQLLKSLNLSVQVRLVGHLKHAAWRAQAVRVGETLDATSRTLTITVTVDNPYLDVIPGVKPPLIKGMFTEVEFLAPGVPRLAIPRHAIHQGNVYLLDADDKLRIQPVKVRFHQGALAILQPDSLAPGAKVILTDLIPAVPGMPLTPTMDDIWQTKITELANGGGVFK